MEIETFFNKYCPVPVRYHNTEQPQEQFADCALEENDCPFKDVDFSKVDEQRVLPPEEQQ